MKTKNSPLILTLLLALLAFSAAHAQSDGNKQWGGALKTKCPKGNGEKAER